MNRIFYYTLFCVIKTLDLPSLVFQHPFGRMMVFSTTPSVLQLDKACFNAVCALCDVAMSIRGNNAKYIFYSALFPSDVSSITNLATTLTPSVLDCFLVTFDPVYLAIVDKSLGLVTQLFSFNEVLSREADIVQNKGLSPLQAPYLNGYRNNHIPGLNGFWYLHTCMFEQYSKLCYTLVLIFACFFIKKEPRLSPIFTNGSTFISYLPHTIRSRYLSVYCVLGFTFEYLFMHFRVFDIVNTNFLYWISFAFIMLYIFDIKYGSIGALKSRKDSGIAMGLLV